MQTVCIRSCWDKPVQVLCHWTFFDSELGLPSPFSFGTGLVISEIRRKLMFPLQWRHLVVRKGNAQDGHTLPTFLCSSCGEIPLKRTSGLTKTLMSRWQDLTFLHPPQPLPNPVACRQAPAATSVSHRALTILPGLVPTLRNLLPLSAPGPRTTPSPTSLISKFLFLQHMKLSFLGHSLQSLFRAITRGISSHPLHSFWGIPVFFKGQY